MKPNLSTDCSHLELLELVLAILCKQNNNKNNTQEVNDTDKWENPPLKVLDKICLTCSQGSQGRWCTRKRTSATAGWASILALSVQAKIRSPFNQDMLTFSGASYFTAERRHAVTWTCFVRLGGRANASAATCVFQGDGRLVRPAAGVSCVSLHPDLCRLVHEQFVFNECAPGRVDARKPLFGSIVT